MIRRRRSRRILRQRLIALPECQRLVDKDATLTSLDLVEQGMDDDDLFAIGEAMVGNNTLKALNISDNEFGDQGIIGFIEDALQNNTSLEKLYLALNFIGLKSAVAIGKVLGQNKSLKFLHLARTNINGTTLSAMLNAGLHSNIGLEAIYLNFNTLFCSNNSKLYACQGVLGMERFLQTSRTLKQIHLDSTGLNSFAASKLCEALYDSEIVEVIDLDNNDIGDDGAIAVSKLLKVNKSLRYLPLSSNGITEVGIKAICSGLEVNPSVGCCSFNDNPIGRNGLLMLKTLVERHNTTLKCIHLDFFHEVLAEKTMYFYLLMNRIGRNEMKSFDTMPVSLWPRILSMSSKFSENRSFLFWFIQQMPQLFIRQLKPKTNTNSNNEKEQTNQIIQEFLTKIDGCKNTNNKKQMKCLDSPSSNANVTNHNNDNVASLPHLSSNINMKKRKRSTTVNNNRVDIRRDSAPILRCSTSTRSRRLRQRRK